LKLNPNFQNAVRSGEISAGHGRAILSLEDEMLQKNLFENIVKNQLNVRQAEQVAQGLKNPSSPKSVERKEKELPNHLKKAQKNLSDTLEVNVEIKSAGKGKKGKIILDFNTEEELENILSHLR
jgi:ParB family chromosome partitioning protein